MSDRERRAEPLAGRRTDGRGDRAMGADRRARTACRPATLGCLARLRRRHARVVQRWPACTPPRRRSPSSRSVTLPRLRASCRSGRSRSRRARLPEVLRRETPPSRLVLTIGNAWFAVGPALVLARRPPDQAPVWCSRYCSSRRRSPPTSSPPPCARRLCGARGWREQIIEARWVYGVDIALTPGRVRARRRLAATPGAPLRSLRCCPCSPSSSANERPPRKRLRPDPRLPRHGTRARRRCRGRRQYTGDHCKDVVALATSRRRPSGAQQRAHAQPRIRRAAARRGQDRDPQGDHQQARPLTDSEFEIVKSHTIEGQRMLDRVGGFMRDVGVIVRDHHERWDGRGYPDGLAGEGSRSRRASSPAATPRAR